MGGSGQTHEQLLKTGIIGTRRRSATSTPKTHASAACPGLGHRHVEVGSLCRCADSEICSSAGSGTESLASSDGQFKNSDRGSFQLTTRRSAFWSASLNCMAMVASHGNCATGRVIILAHCHVQLGRSLSGELQAPNDDAVRLRGRHRFSPPC